MKKYISHRYLAKISRHKWAPFLLFIFSIMSSTVLIFPTDLYLAFVVFYNRKRFFYYALIATFGSVLGSTLTYTLGFYLIKNFKNEIFSFFSIKEETFYFFSKVYLDYGFWILFLSNIPPIPHKLMCFIAGAFRLNIYIFLIIIAINRVVRYFGIAFLTSYFRNRFGLILKRVNYYLFIFGIIILLIILGIFFLFKKIH